MPRVLVVSAHPDDELFGAGYLAKLVEEGADVHLLCSTRGEGGEVGEPPVGPKSRLGQYRVLEMQAAARALGARSLEFLDFIDPWMEIDGEAQAIDATPEEYAIAVTRHLNRVTPEIIVTHGSNGEYGHPQHVFTHQTVRRAALGADRRPAEILTWCANNGENGDDKITNTDDAADFSLDISRWFGIKLAMARAHRSQMAMFMRNNGVADIALAMRKTEAFKRWAVA
ncbi:MAG: PIG-L family deacetylase [Chloroflexota bacterium]